MCVLQLSLSIMAGNEAQAWVVSPVDQADTHGRTPLYIACAVGHLAIAKLLLFAEVMPLLNLIVQSNQPIYKPLCYKEKEIKHFVLCSFHCENVGSFRVCLDHFFFTLRVFFFKPFYFEPAFLCDQVFLHWPHFLSVLIDK